MQGGEQVRRRSAIWGALIVVSVWLGACDGGDQLRSTVLDSETTLSVPTVVSVGEAWQDRGRFRAGLVDGTVLGQLPGASVYEIDLEIAPDFNLLTGRQSVHYTNREDRALGEVYFQLFPNTAGGATNITSAEVDGQPVEPGYEYLDSAIRVPLPTPLPPGGVITVELEYAVQVSREMAGNYGLFGYFDGFLVLDEFYPVIPVYDDEGWNVQDPPPIGDVTYFDTSFYLVRVTAPADLVVISSGSLLEQEVTGDTRVVTLAAGPARDFYLAAGPNLIMLTEQVGPTTINSHAPPDYRAGAEFALQVAADALDSFGERFGPYPYREFDVVGTPMQALGIEYPGMTNIALDLYDLEAEVLGLPARVVLESTVAHEVAHQWFYNVVGNDQVDDPWLDEAVVQYLTGLYYRDVYGEAAEQGLRESWVSRWDRIAGAEVPIGLATGAYTADEYSPIIYGRGPLFVALLEEEMGTETFAEFLRDYYQSNQWGIATGEGFRELAEQHCGCDLAGLFEKWVYPAG